MRYGSVQPDIGPTNSRRYRKRLMASKLTRIAPVASVMLLLAPSIGQAFQGGSCGGNIAPTAEAGPNRQGSAGTPMNFDGSGSTDPDGSVVSYWWNFGDGSFTGWQPNAVVSHTYAGPGTYSARLWAKDNCAVFSAVDTAVITITNGNACANNVAPNADAGSDRNASVNQSLTFNGGGSADAGGSITSYSWNFGDGSNASGVSAAHAYSSSGNFTVTLTVTDNCGATDTDTASVTITSTNPCGNNQAPVANGGPDRQGAVGAAVSFSASGSTDANGNITEYWWNFGDGDFTGWQTQPNTSHVYDGAGTFTARLWVRDSCGSMSAADLVTVTVGGGEDECDGNAVPNANAGPDANGTVGLALAFSGTASNDPDGNIESYSWNFGNGQTLSGSSVSYTYTTAGTYNVVLSVTDDCGAVDTDTKVVVVAPQNPCNGNGAPIANAGPNQNANVGANLSFNGGGSLDLTGSIVSYQWNFGDSTSASGVTVNKTYTTAGTYNVTLTVTDSCGLSNVDSASVTITPSNPCANNTLPTANAGADRNVTAGVPVSITGSGTDANGTIASYWFNFGNGQSTGWQNSATVSHTYNVAGTYTLSLWVQDNCGGSSAADTAVVTVTSSNPCQGNTPPTANAGQDRSVQAGTALSFSGSGSSDSNGTIQSYSWNFGNGQTATGSSVSFTYPSAGTFTVSLTVTDNCGATNTDQAVVTVTPSGNTALNANFKVYKLSSVTAAGAESWIELVSPTEQIEIGAQLKVDATSSTGAVSFYSWQMGDGSFNSGPVVYYQYDEVGSYNVEVTVFDASWANYDVYSRPLNIATTMQFVDALPLADDNSNDIAIDGNRAYTSHFNGKLTSIDVTNPSNMQVLSTINAPVGKAIAAANGNVYLCATTSGLAVYQGGNTPTLLTTYNTAAQDSQSARDAVASGKVVFLAAGVAGLKVLNMTNPSSPALLGARVLTGNTSAENIVVSNGRAYVSDNTGKVFIFDVSAVNVNNPTPSTPVLLGTVNVGWIVSHLSVTGNTLVVQASPQGLFMYNVTSAASPALLGSYNISADAVGQSPGGVLAIGNRVYVTFGQVLGIGTSVAKVSISDPSDAYIMEWISLSNFQISGVNRGPVLHNGRLFMANSVYKAAVIGIPMNTN